MEMFGMSLLGLLLIVAQYSATIYDADEDYHDDYEDAWGTELQQKEMDLIPIGKRTTATETENLVRGKEYSLGKTLQPGDVIEVCGSYGRNTDRYSVYLMGDNDSVLFHVNPRPLKDTTVMNNRIKTKWENTIKSELPDIEFGEDFLIKIAMGDEFYQVLFNDVPLSRNFPYHNELSLVKSIKFLGGNKGFTWKGMILNGEHKYGKDYLEVKAQKQSLINLRRKIEENVYGQSSNTVKLYADSTEGSIDLLQWGLLKIIDDKDQSVKLDDNTVQWILSNREILEMLMTSGDVPKDKYKEALEILVDLMNEDPLIKTDRLRMRIAVAIALTFTTPVELYAFAGKYIDWMERYKTYIELIGEGVLLEQFYKGTAWHLRYVVGCQHTEEEQVWARANMHRDIDNLAGNMSRATAGFVPYGKVNGDGFKMSSQPRTLKTISEIGGLCGTRARFRTAMMQSSGVPALPVLQKGHMGFMWWTPEGIWVLPRGNAGPWGRSNTTKSYHYTWNKKSCYFPVMNLAQKHLPEYRLSEKMRIAAKMAQPEDMFGVLEDAATVCPHNYAAWVDLSTAMAVGTLEKAAVHSALLPSWESLRAHQGEESTISLDATTTSECFVDAMTMTNGTSKTVSCCDQTTGSITLDFPAPVTVNSIQFQWKIKDIESVEYDIYAMGANGEFELVRTQESQILGKWKGGRTSSLGGWEMKTNKIMIELRIEKIVKDKYLCIGELFVKGILDDAIAVVSDGKPVTSSELSTEAGNLVDNDEGTTWTANADNSWFEIDFGRICAIRDIEFSWVEGTQPDGVTISYRVGDGPETTFAAEQPFYEVPMDMDTGVTVLRVTLSGGNPVLKGVTVRGREYSSKEILKLQVKRFYEMHRQVKAALIEQIDNIDYTE